MSPNSMLVAAVCITAAFVLWAGLRTLSREDISTTSLLFFLSTLGAASWLLTLALILTSASGAGAAMWGRASCVAVLLIPVSVYHFSSTACTGKRSESLVVGMLWTFTLILAISAIGSSLFVQGAYEYRWGHYPQLGTAGGAIAVWTVLLLGLGLLRLIRECRIQIDRFTLGRLRILIAAFAAACFGLVDFLPAFGVNVVPVGFLGMAGFAVITFRGLRAMSLTALTPSYAADQILATMQGAVLVTDLDGRVRVANEAATELLHYPRGSLPGCSLSDFVASPYNVGRASDTLAKGGTVRDRAMLWMTKDQRLVEVGVSASLLRDAAGFPSGIVYVASDISEKESAKQIEYQAFHDALTGLPNREYLRRNLEKAIDESDDEHVPAVLFLDLDGFKIVNDSLGHSAGDELLQVIARRLKDVVRNDDIVCRLGGDEFVILMRIRSHEHATLIGEKVLEAVQQQLTINGERLHLTGSVGIALYPTHGNDSEVLLKSADSAMYAAKDAGKNQIMICGPDIAKKATRRFRLESELRQAVSREELVLHYQPIVDLSTDTIVGAEALLRWRRGGRLIPPSEFLPVAEETGLIREMGEWALFMACRDANGWIGLGSEPIRIAVNLSAEQLRDRSITAAVSSALNLNEIPASCLVLEVTESAAMVNVERSITILRELKDLGVQIAIDDFGTGYSSLSYLQRFPIDLLKIDRSFVEQMGRMRSSGAIVSATVAMARALELEVVAEGVETRYQLAILRLEKCRYAQGFALGRPVPVEEFPEMVRDWNVRNVVDDTSGAPTRLYLPQADLVPVVKGAFD